MYAKVVACLVQLVLLQLVLMNSALGVQTMSQHEEYIERTQGPSMDGIAAILASGPEMAIKTWGLLHDSIWSVQYLPHDDHIQSFTSIKIEQERADSVDYSVRKEWRKQFVEKTMQTLPESDSSESSMAFLYSGIGEVWDWKSLSVCTNEELYGCTYEEQERLRSRSWSDSLKCSHLKDLVGIQDFTKMPLHEMHNFSFSKIFGLGVVGKDKKAAGTVSVRSKTARLAHEILSNYPSIKWIQVCSYHACKRYALDMSSLGFDPDTTEVRDDSTWQ